MSVRECECVCVDRRGEEEERGREEKGTLATEVAVLNTLKDFRLFCKPVDVFPVCILKLRFSKLLLSSTVCDSHTHNTWLGST